LLADSNTFSGTNTFSTAINGSITGNAGTVTNGVYTTTFGGLFAGQLAGTTTDALAEGSTNLYYTSARATANFVSSLAATTSVASITTLPNLSILSSQVSDLATTINAAYPFQGAGNSTSTLTQFNGGLTAYASTTIGNGTAAGGLTINGGATTTGNAYVAGNAGIGMSDTSFAKLAVNATAVADGSELVTNGGFTGSATGWTLQSSCSTYSSNQVTVFYDAGCQADTDSPYLSTDVALVSGHVYRLTFDVTTNGDQPYVYFDNDSYSSGAFSDGAQTVTFTADYTGTDTLYFDSENYTTDAGWSLDNVSLREMSTVLPAFVAYDYLGATTTVLGDISNNTAIGHNALLAVTGADNIGIGYSAGYGASNASGSNFFGNSAGYNAANAVDSNFFGRNAGKGADSATVSNFIGLGAGLDAYYAANSNFIGNGTGNGATNAANSNFLGQAAGNAATDAPNSNFIGAYAGYDATSAAKSNFFGLNAGNSATGASDSNFFGNGAGYGAANAKYSNFIGSSAGGSAQNASSSSFIGDFAGYNAANAAHSIFIGSNAGNNDAVDNTSGGTSIAIGQFAGTGGFSNSIAVGRGVINSATQQLNIGNVLYATGIYNSDVQSSAAAAGGKFGIGTTTPGSILSVQGVANFTPATSTFYATGGINLAGGCFAVNGACLSSGSSFAYPFPSNATSTKLTFSGGLLSLASTTIGNGTAAGGLTVNGGATTTGDLLVQGSATTTNLGFTNATGDSLSLASSLTVDSAGSANLRLDRGATSNYSLQAFTTNGADQWTLGLRNDSTNNFYIHDAVNGTNPVTIKQGGDLLLAPGGNVGIGTTSPSQALSVSGNGLFSGNLTAANITATGTLTVSGTSGTSTIALGQGFAVGNTFLVQQGSGNVGIGTTGLIANHALTVSGNEYLGGGLGVGGSNTTPGSAYVYGSAGDATSFTVNAPNISSAAAFNLSAPIGTKAFAITATGENLARGMFYVDGSYGIGPGGNTYGRDTYISRSSTSTLLVSSDMATGAATLSVTGSIGVGTTSPYAKLSVVGDAVLSGSSPTLTLSDTGGNSFNTIQNASGALQFNTGSGNSIVFQQAGVEAARFLTGTRAFGIGTTSPSQALSVSGNGYISGGFGIGMPPAAAGGLYFNRAGNDPFFTWYENGANIGQIRADSTRGGIYFADTTGGTTYFQVNTSGSGAGNVGVGTTTPGSLLSIGNAGGINFTTATSSFNTTGGINIKSGCYAVNGTCLSTGGSSFAYPFSLAGNATSTLTQFNGGLTAYASSTIGNGTAGLTVSGNATTTGNLLVQGSIGIGSSVLGGTLGILQNTNSGILIQGSSGVNFGNASFSLYNAAQDSQWSIAAGGGKFSLYDDLNGAGPFTIESGAAANSLYISSTGNVGMGTSSPFATLSLQKSYGSANTTLFAVSSSTNSGGTAADTLFSVDSAGNTTVGNASSAGDAIIQVAGDANAWSIGYKSSDKSFNIASSTSFSGTSALSIAKNGNATFTGSGGTCTINGSGACTSDIRLKTNIATTTGQDALDRLSKLDAITYNWTDPSLDQSQRLGVVAQEVQKVFPQLVGSTTVNFMGVPGTYLTVDYGGLAAPLIAAVNELNLRTGFLATTTATSTPDALANGPFAAASDWLKSALASALNAIGDVAQAGVRNVGAAIYATAGTFNQLFAQTITADTVKAKELCLEDVCINKTQLQNLLNQQSSGGSTGGSSAQSPAPAPQDTTASAASEASSTPEAASEPAAPVSADMGSSTTADSSSGTAAPDTTASRPAAPATDTTAATDAPADAAPATTDTSAAPAPAPAPAPATGGESGTI
jgi:hypothetical protein